MRYLLLFLLAFLAACDNTSETITAPVQKDTVATVATGINLSGKVNLSNAGGLDASSISVSVAGIVVHPKDDGTWTLTGNAPKVAARASSVLDTVKIIVAGDTLVEVPVESWSAILPTNYIVQRNVGVIVPKKFSGKKVQAVFWDNDSIAHVLNLGVGTTKWKFSGFIYTAYNDSQFKENGKLYDLFVRVKSGDSVVAYTEISEVTAKVGDLDFDSTQISETVNHVRYLYTYVPNDSSLKNWNDTVFKKLVIDTVIDTSIVTDTNIFRYANASNGEDNYVTFVANYSDTTLNSEDSLVIHNDIGLSLHFDSVKDTLYWFYGVTNAGDNFHPIFNRDTIEAASKVGTNVVNFTKNNRKVRQYWMCFPIDLVASKLTYYKIRETIIKHYI